MSLRDYIGKGKTFEGVIVINLPERLDRKFHVQEQFKAVGIDDVVEWLPAIKHRFGMVGCSLSHLECVKIAKRRKWKSVLIFEDDIVFTEHFEKAHVQALSQLNFTNWSVFHFGAMLMDLCSQFSPNLLRIGYNWAAHAVAIHERAYDFIISKYDHSYSETDNSKPWGGHYPFDGFINKEVYDAGFEIYSAYPLLVTQRPDKSDTWGYHRDYKDLIEASYDKQIMNEVQVLIISKDRPMQLYALLETFFKYNRDARLPEINVLYKSGSVYVPGYEILKEKYAGKVNFHLEENFHTDYKNLIKRKRFVTFLVDDTIFFNEFKLANGCTTLAEDLSVLSFSYRLGTNTTYSYINNIPFATPSEYNTGKYITKVDWTKEYPYIDFGYPFEISSSMYRSSDVLSMMDLCNAGWESPNTFELTGTTMVRTFHTRFGKHIATYRKSVAVSIPLNRVQNVHLNRTLNDMQYTSEELQKQFMDGKQLNLDEINEQWSTNSVHVELRPAFKHRT